ncbi:MAG TPA: DM13 domain-containing protein, partial [Acidimicrobiales bacterium]|nr:DM13 domain-containing protein [Acidimicrobiales bacterium]
LVWFQPQKLFIDHNVDDTIPVAAAVPSASAPVRAEPIELARGRFVSRDHGTTGVARLLELADTRRIVRLEGLDTSNGPDLYLYLTTNAAGGAEAAFDDDFVSLGRLKGNQGDQNYDVPVDVDLSRFASVVIWCDRFNSAFGAAPLVR